MEPTQRVHIIDEFLEDVEQQIDVLERALAAQKTAQEEVQHGHGTDPAQEHTQTAHALQAECTLWGQARERLSEVRGIFEQIEGSERQRGVIA